MRRWPERYIVWDMDGVLVDSAYALELAYAEVGLEHADVLNGTVIVDEATRDAKNRVYTELIDVGLVKALPPLGLFRELTETLPGSGDEGMPTRLMVMTQASHQAAYDVSMHHGFRHWVFAHGCTPAKKASHIRNIVESYDLRREPRPSLVYVDNCLTSGLEVVGVYGTMVLYCGQSVGELREQVLGGR